MGPYCRYCDHRCFVERRIPDTRTTVLLATCSAGMAHDRSAVGHDHTTALNPRGDLS
jgi:alcohol dehydrogenase class IV